MSKHTLIVIGTSAGGIPALTILVGGLQKDLDASICVARHADPTRSSVLPDILTRLRTLPASYPQPGTQLTPRHIFLAPSDHQLLIEREQMIVVQEPQQHPRDDIDRLFQSAAIAYGPQVIGIILTGRLTDGTRGLQIVKQHGGTTIIQDPNEATFPSMPHSAQKHCTIDYCLPLAQIAPLLQRLTEGQMASIGDG